MKHENLVLQPQTISTSPQQRPIPTEQLDQLFVSPPHKSSSHQKSLEAIENQTIRQDKQIVSF